MALGGKHETRTSKSETRRGLTERLVFLNGSLPETLPIGTVLSLTQSPEGWQSGLMRTPGERVESKGSREFESRPLRQSHFH